MALCAYHCRCARLDDLAMGKEGGLRSGGKWRERFSILLFRLQGRVNLNQRFQGG